MKRSGLTPPSRLQKGGRLGVGLFRSNDHGYTLVELTVAMAVAGMVVFIAFVLVIGTLAVADRWQRQASAHGQAHATWRQVTDELRYADRVQAESDGWSVRLGGRTISYTDGVNGSLRNGRNTISGPSLRADARIDPIVRRDTLRGYSVSVQVMDSSGRARTTIVLDSVVRARSLPYWPVVDGR